MEPIVIYRKENGKFGITRGLNKFNILKIMGFTELRPEMYNYSDNSYNKNILKMKDFEVESVN